MSWIQILDVAWIQRIRVFGESLSEIFSGEQEGGESGSHNTTAIISKFRSEKSSMSVRESGICIIVQPPHQRVMSIACGGAGGRVRGPVKCPDVVSFTNPLASGSEVGNLSRPDALAYV